MVNTGRPSRGCGTCKARHIKCDEGRPWCSKCTKAKRTCLGYRDELDLVLRPYRNATANVEMSSSIASQRDRDPKTSYGLVHGYVNQFLVHNPSLPVTSQALQFFLRDFVLFPSNKDISRGYLDGIISRVNAPNSSKLIAGMLKAVTLSYLSNRFQASTLAIDGQREYAQSLHLLQQQIRDPTSEDIKTTLSAIILMGLYETISSKSAVTDAWLSHIKGAHSILRHQVVSGHPFGYGMALFLLLDMASHQRQDGGTLASTPPRKAESFPAEKLDEMPNFSMSCDDMLCPAVRESGVQPTVTLSLSQHIFNIQPLLVEASSLLNSETPLDENKVRRLKSSAQMQLAEIGLWPQCQPKEWQPETIGITTVKAEVTNEEIENLEYYPGPILVFYDLYTSGVFLTYYTTRLRLLDIIAKCIQQLSKDVPYWSSYQYQQIQKATERCANELCASVPYQLVGDTLKHAKGPIKIVASDTRPVSGLLLMWPLFAGSILSLVPSRQQLWMRGRLKWIGENLGIGQALALANSRDPIPDEMIAQGYTLVWGGSMI